MPHPVRYDLNHARILRLHGQGLTAVAIARDLGVRPQRVRNALRALGVRRRSVKKVPHGYALFRRWFLIRRGCTEPAHELYPRYGARGVGLCPEWRTFWPFYDWAVASGFELGRALVLPPGAKVFSRATCSWVSRDEQPRPHGANYRKPVTAFGVTKSVPAWAQDPRCAVTERTLRRRLRQGMRAEKAISLPMYADRPETPTRLAATSRPRVDWDEVVRLRVEDGRTSAQIARQFDRTAGTIRAGLRARGVHKPEPVRGPHVERLRQCWTNMRHRCEQKSHPAYRLYGARGARVCPAWREFAPFYRWAIEAGYRPGLWLTRRKGTRVYSAENCWWAEAEIVRIRTQHSDP